MTFRDRVDAGSQLAEAFKTQELRHPVVVALPRGGVPVAAKIAERLHAPLDVLVVRKIGAPGNREFGIGAIAEGGFYWLNPQSLENLGLNDEHLEGLLQSEMQEVERRVSRYRANRPMTPVLDRDVILVDDGLATGVTAFVAAQWLQQQGARSITLAAPVCAQESAENLSALVDSVICLEKPDRFYSVGAWYEDFSQTSDDEVLSLLKKFRPKAEAPAPSPTLSAPIAEDSEPDLPWSEEIEIMDGEACLPGHLTLPQDAKGIVIFAHGSGSSRFSPRNLQVAQSLNQAGLGTLLFDLLTPEEAGSRENVFDIEFLAKRLVLAYRWTRAQDSLKECGIGFFGASTGGAAALWAAADLGDEICAVVSRGGRPDLALSRLPEVRSPVLLIVGENDGEVVRLNELALDPLNTSEMILVPHATHLFEEPGTLEIVCDEAQTWFLRFFKQRREQRRPTKKTSLLRKKSA